jgi:hypothetical protein
MRHWLRAPTLAGPSENFKLRHYQRLRRIDSEHSGASAISLRCSENPLKIGDLKVSLFGGF